MPYEIYIYGDQEPIKVAKEQYAVAKRVFEGNSSGCITVNGRTISRKSIKEIRVWGEDEIEHSEPGQFKGNADVLKERFCTKCGYRCMSERQGNACPICHVGVMTPEAVRSDADSFYDNIRSLPDDENRIKFIKEQYKLRLINLHQAKLANLYVKKFLHNKTVDLAEVATELFTKGLC